MRRALRVTGLLFLGALLVDGALLACGARTGLFAPELDGELDDATAGRDGAGATDAASDGDGALPPLDARAPRDADLTGCADAASTVVYLVTTDNELFAFDPPQLAFRDVGRLACPSQPGATPFSMAVDRAGVASVLFNDGELYRVSTATASCQATGFRVGQLGFQVFGMGYAADQGGPTETLYIAGDARGSGASGLARIDTGTLQVARVGPFVPSIERAELTGTGDGRLYAFYERGSLRGSFLGEVDPATGRVLGESGLPTVDQGQGWAFAFWGGDFWLFTSPDGLGSRVTRYRPTDGTITEVARLSTVVVGAGVSTCAPRE